MTMSAMEAPSQAASPRQSWLHRRLVRKVLSYPIWGGSYSYIVVETDPAEELLCIHALQTSASLEQRRAVLGPTLGLSPEDPLPSTLSEAISALSHHYPPVHDDNEEIGSYDGKAARLPEWIRLLGLVPPNVKDLLAAWNREERNEVYDQVNASSSLPPVAKYYFNANVEAVKKQETRWRHGTKKGPIEWFFFCLWALLMQLGTIVPDTVSVFLGAVLAVFRSAPIRLQGQIMLVAALDYPWTDERLLRFIAFQRFLGLLPSALFGICAAFLPSFHRTAFHGVASLAWKAAICITWQMTLLNWKNIYDLYYCRRITRACRQTQLTEQQRVQLQDAYDRLQVCNALAYAWLGTYRLSNRSGAQISYYKQDHGDASKCLLWSIGMPREKSSSKTDDDARSKFAICLAIIAIGALICASTFPVDAYAGLIALAYYGPLIIRSAVDAWDPSQCFDDLLRLFTTTAGPTFPSTLALLANVIYWGITHRALYVGFRNVRFGVTFAALCFLSLYPKLWGEGFRSAGIAVQKCFAKQEESKSDQKGKDEQDRQELGEAGEEKERSSQSDASASTRCAQKLK